MVPVKSGPYYNIVVNKIKINAGREPRGGDPITIWYNVKGMVFNIFSRNYFFLTFLKHVYILYPVPFFSLYFNTIILRVSYFELGLKPFLVVSM